MAKERKISDIDLLYEELFGSIPAKPGTAYERITAIALAALGWQDVVHDRTERADGKRADHQLDVTCTNGDGSVRRLLIECKEKDTDKVGQGEMIKLYSVRDEIGASHAAMITKRAFTKGARDTAYDHDLAMLRLRAYDPAIDDGTWVKKAAINLNLSMTVQEEVEVLVDSAWRPAKELGIWAEGWMDVFDADGERIGNVAGLFALGEPVEGQDDASRKGFAIDGEPVQVEGFDDLVKIMGMRWTEREVTDTMQVVSETQGTPQLVVQQLDENGNRYTGRVIVDSKLKAWNFDEDGHVVEVNPPVNVPALPPAEPAAD
jgi:Restriction endonuclease